MKLQVYHAPGRHCASTGMADLLAYHGLPWSEALCFGIGAGLGLWYLELPGTNPSRVVHVRSQDLEPQFFNRIGVSFGWEQFDRPADATGALMRAIDSGRPALLQTDIFYLPYFKTRTHFAGHVIMVWGYDPVEKAFFVTDTEREEIQEVPFSAMEEARYSGHAFFPAEGNQFAPASLQPPEDLSRTVADAILFQSRRMLDPQMDISGIDGLRMWQAKLHEWADDPEWQWLARFAYQIIEKRGTGGGGFRRMYSDFLREAESLLPEVKSRGLAESMGALARAWTDLADEMKAISERDVPDFGPAAERLALLVPACEGYHREALALQVPD